MSWSEGFQDVSADEIAELTPTQAHTSSEEYIAEAFDEARLAASAIAHSGIVGDPDKVRFNVWLSGHANPNHEVTPGWANDFIAINVSQLTPTPEVPDGGTEAA